MSMYQGRSIYVFKGNHSNADAVYQFATLICFDWIASSDTKRMWEWLLKGTQTRAQRLRHHLSSDLVVRGAMQPRAVPCLIHGTSGGFL